MPKTPSDPLILSGRSAALQISECLRADIVRGILKPNQRLIEEAIAEEFRVSRTPVREAIRKLEAEGLVEYVPQRGVVVRPVAPEELAEIYALRILLEGYAARLAAERVQEEDLVNLENLCAFSEAIKSDAGDRPNQAQKQIDLNDEFHRAIITLSGNKRLERITAKGLETPLIYRTLYWYDQKNETNSQNYHRRILAALRERNSDKSEQLMQEHLKEAKDITQKAIERLGQQTED